MLDGLKVTTFKKKNCFWVNFSFLGGLSQQAPDS